jgi:hypothetical protein
MQLILWAFRVHKLHLCAGLMKKDLLPLAQVQPLTAHISTPTTPKKVRNLYSRRHSNATEESKL